jgi:hypothetical protein
MMHASVFLLLDGATAEVPSLSVPTNPSGLFVLGVVALCIYALIQLLRQYVPLRKEEPRSASADETAKAVAAAVREVVSPLLERVGHIGEQFAVVKADVERHGEEIARQRDATHDLRDQVQAVSTRQEIAERTSPPSQFPAPPRR